MRTTISLDDDVYEVARRRAFDEQRSLGDVISQLAKLGLKAQNEHKPARPLGKFAGQVQMADDFNETPKDVLDALASEFA